MIFLFSSKEEKTFKNFSLFFFVGTQSPDAVNKLLRLSDSSHQIKSRAPQKHNPNSTLSLPRNSSPLIPSTGLTSVRELNPYQVTKIRDTNKLTSESSSLNLKAAAPSTLYIRSHTRELFFTKENNIENKFDYFF